MISIVILFLIPKHTSAISLLARPAQSVEHETLNLTLGGRDGGVFHGVEVGAHWGGGAFLPGTALVGWLVGTTWTPPGPSLDGAGSWAWAQGRKCV